MNSVDYLYPFTESFIDYPDDESLSLTIYFLGCDNNCPHCSNPELQDKNYDHFSAKHHKDISILLQILKADASRLRTNKLTFIGGDPLYKDNIENTKKLLNELKDEFDICIYTGHSLQYVKDNDVTGFTFLKIGKYIYKYKQESKKTDEYMQFASSNQELYDKDFNLISANGIYYFG